MHSCQVYHQIFRFLQTFASHNRTQKDKSKNHSKNWRERFENRRYKNVAELAVVYHKMSKSLVTGYEDGKRKKITFHIFFCFVFHLYLIN